MAGKRPGVSGIPKEEPRQVDETWRGKMVTPTGLEGGSVRVLSGTYESAPDAGGGSTPSGKLVRGEAGPPSIDRLVTGPRTCCSHRHTTHDETGYQ